MIQTEYNGQIIRLFRRKPAPCQHVAFSKLQGDMAVRDFTILHRIAHADLDMLARPIHASISRMRCNLCGEIFIRGGAYPRSFDRALGHEYDADGFPIGRDGKKLPLSSEAMKMMETKQ